MIIIRSAITDSTILRLYREIIQPDECLQPKNTSLFWVKYGITYIISHYIRRRNIVHEVFSREHLKAHNQPKIVIVLISACRGKIR